MRPLKSQWEFGDLFTQAPARRVLSVSELTATVKRLLEREVGKVWVAGEITNARLHSSGHLYFALKDQSAQLSCVLFRGEARAFNRDLIRDGVGVNLQGELTIYEARGQYQLVVTAVELQGIGALQAAFEKLKQKLQAEGLFAPERKRPLPRFPRRIGLVTSSSGAAIRDVLHALERRHPGLPITLAPCRVQGQGAADEVAQAIRLLNEWSAGADRDPARRIDLILVTRGGGSLEDLWAFNEEIVARAIYESALPVISAIGHEIDFTISDFVADFRAATPTAAAEIITEAFHASRQSVPRAMDRLRWAARDALLTRRQEVESLIQRWRRQHPRRWLQEQWQRLDDLQGGLVRCARSGFRFQSTRCHQIVQRLGRARPVQVLARQREALLRAARLWRERAREGLRVRRQRLEQWSAKLRLLSPQQILERGYSITLDSATGKVVRSAGEVEAGQELRTQVRHGEIRSIVKSARTSSLDSDSAST